MGYCWLFALFALLVSDIITHYFSISAYYLRYLGHFCYLRSLGKFNQFRPSAL